MSDVVIKLESGECPRGVITITEGNVGQACNLHILGGYHKFTESSIDLDGKACVKLIAALTYVKDVYGTEC